MKASLPTPPTPVRPFQLSSSAFRSQVSSFRPQAFFTGLFHFPLSAFRFSFFRLPRRQDLKRFVNGLRRSARAWFAFRATRRQPAGPVARAIAIAVAALLGLGDYARAASAVWDGSQNTGTWSDTANWSASPVPGTGDTATFNSAGGTVDVIDLGAGVTINTIYFDTSSVAAYTIGSGAVNSQTLTLNNSGTITANSTINANQLFNAALVLGTDATAQSYAITNSDTSNTLTFAGTITGGSTGTAGIKTLNVNTAGSGERVIIGGAITAGGATAIALTKTGTGTLRLNGANTLGDVAVNDGTLFTEKSMTFGNLSVAASKTFQFGAQDAAYTININGLSGAGTVTTANSGGFQRNLTLGNNDASADFSGVLTQASNRALVLTKLGAGTQTLSGSVANTQAGGTGVGFDTYIQAGTLALNKTAAIALPGDVFINGGTLQLSGTGDNQIADTAPVSWSSGSFDLNGRSETIGAFTISVLSASANQINVAAGKTFTAAGNVNIFNSAATTLGTNVTFNSAGSVPTSTYAVTGASTFIFGQDSTTSSTTRTNTLDMRNLGVFNAGTSGTELTSFVVGNYVQATGSNYNNGGIITAYLAPSSTIYATSFGVGKKGAGSQPGQFNNTLYLGSSATAIHATTITVGETGAISTGSTMMWDAGVTSGSLTLNGTGATTAVTNMYVGYKTDTASSGAGNRLGTVDLSNGTVTGSITNLYVGYKGAIGDSGTGSPTTTGVFKLGAGTAGALSNLTIGNITLGSSGQTAGRDNPTNGTFQLDGGTVSVTNNIVLTNENTLDTRTGTLTINGGAMTIGGDITSGVTKATSTLTLSGGTLDMTGGLIGTLANPIDTFTINPATAATLKNVGSINGTGGITKTGAGILTVDGANTFTGDTLISAGKVALANTLAIQYSAYDTTGSTGAIGLDVTGFTTPTLGGLKGSVNLATAITGYGSVTSLTLNPQTGATPSYAGIIANGAAGMTLVKNGAGTQTLTNANSYSGGTTISAGVLTVSNAGGLGSGNVSNAATLNLTAGGVTYTGLSNTGAGALSGSGTVNVTLGTGNSSTLLNGNYSSFTGIMNIGTGAAAGAGKVQANGADNASATYNVLNHGTLYITSGGTRNADLTLGGGDTGETLGQLRVDTAALNWAGAITLTGSVTGTGDFTFGGNNNLTISGGVGESGGSQVLKKGGAGTLIIASAASYSGTTTVSAGTLQIGNGGTVGTLGTGAVANAGTLVFNRTDTYTLGSSNLVTGAGTVRLNSGTVAAAVDNQFNTTGSLTFGASAGATTVAGLDLSSGSSTFASMLVQTDSSTANTLAIGSGKTLQINGVLTVGYNSTATSTTKLTATGLGTLSLGTSGVPTNANVQIGNGQTTNISNGATFDMSGLSTFYANLGTGTFRVGDPTNSGGTGTAGSTLILAADSTIQAATLTTDSPSGAITNAIKLGSGTNILNVNTLTVGGNAGRSNGTLTFNDLTGTLKVRSKDDPVSGRAILNVGSVNFGTGISQTGNVFNTNGHSADLYFGTMTIGSRGDGTGTTGGTFSFDSGTLDANALVVGNRTAGADGTATTTGIVNLGGGTAVFNSTAGPVQLGTNASTAVGSTASGTLNISGGSVTVAANAGNSLRLGYSSVAGGTANGSINLTGGTLTVAGDIIRGDATGTSTATLNLDGGTLDMGGNKIGGSVASSNLTSLVFASGTLKDVGEINNGAGLDKTSTGTLILDGTNSYTGATTVQGGSLVAGANAPSGSPGAFGNVATAIVLGNGSTLAEDAPALLISGAFTVGRDITVGSLTNTAAYNAIIGGSNTTGTSIYTGGITLNTTAANYTATLQAATGGTVDFQGAFTTNDKAIAIGSTGNAGTVKVTNTLSTTGGINIGYGTLLLGSSDRLGDTTPVTVAGGILDTGTALTDTVSIFNMSSGSLNGTGTITAGTYGLSGGTVNAKLGAGAITVNTGTVVLGSAGRLNSASPLTIQGGQLTIAGTESVAAYQQTGGTLAGTGFILTSAAAYDMQAGTVSANLGGSGIALNKTTGGTVTLSGDNSYSGGTTLSGGKLVLGNSNAVGTGSLALNSTNSGTVSVLDLSGGINIANTINIDTSLGRNNIYSILGANAISGPINLNNTDANTQIIANNAADHALMTVSGNINGATFASNMSFRGTSTGGGTISSVFNTPSAVFDINGTTNWTINSTGNNWGAVTGILSTGNLVLGAANALDASARLDHSGAGDLDLGGFNQSIAGLNRATAVSGAQIINSSATTDSILTIAGMVSDYTYANVIADGATNKVSLVMDSDGRTQTLSGANTYTGSTTVSAGTLAVTGTLATAAINVNGGSLLVGANQAIINAVDVSMNGTLGFTVASANATNQTLGVLTLTADSTIDFGNSVYHNLAFSGIDLATFSLSVWNWTGTAVTGGGASQLLTGSAIIGGSAANVSFYSGINGSGFLGTGMMAGNEIVAVPEPGTIAAGLLLLGGLIFFERRRVRRLFAAVTKVEGSGFKPQINRIIADVGVKEEEAKITL